MRKLGEVCKTSAGGTPLKRHKEYYENGNIPWLLSGEVGQRNVTQSKNYISQLGLDNSSAKIYPSNSVLIAMYGATAGEVGILKFPAASNQAVCAIYPSNRLIPEFIYFFFLHYKEALIAQAVGNAQPNISQKKIKDVQIPIPPLPEQRAIVAKLDAAFAGIAQARANIEQNIENAEELFQSKLNAVFAGRGEGTAGGADRWEEKTLGELCELKNGYAFKSKKFTPKGVRLLRNCNIFHKEIIWDQVAHYPNTALNEFKRFKLEENDIVLTMDRPIISTGLKVARIHKQDLPCLLLQRVLRIRVDAIDNDYFFHWINSPTFLISISPGKSVGVPHISLKEVAEIKVRYPLDKIQQRNIASELDYFESKYKQLNEAYHAKLNHLHELQQSILQRAFSGQLTENEMTV